MFQGNRLGVETHSGGRTGPEVVHQYVRVVEESTYDPLALRFLQVQCQRLLATVEPDEVTRLAVHRAVISAGEVAATRALDLDHPRTKIRELAGGVRRRHRLLEAHDGDTRQRRSRHRVLLGVTLMSD
jgi:hypothetical protein